MPASLSNQEHTQESSARSGGGPPGRRVRISFFALTLIVVGAMFAGAALAHGGRRGQGHGEGHEIGEALDTEVMMDRLDFVFDGLEATEAQRAAITAIVESSLPELAAFHGEAEVLKGAFREALEGGAVDPAEVEVLRTELVDLVDRASRTGLQAIVESWNVLTPDQRSRIMEFHR